MQYVEETDGEAKFWLDPEIELAVNYRLKDKDLGTIEQLIKEREDEIRTAWHKHFSR